MVDQKCEFYKAELWCHGQKAHGMTPWIYTNKKDFDQQRKHRKSYSFVTPSFYTRCWRYDFVIGDWVEFEDEDLST